MSSEGISAAERAVLKEHIDLMDHELDCLQQWVTLLNETMQSIWTGSDAARDLEIFFIKLHGLLAEGLSHIQMQFLPVEAIDLMNTENPEHAFPDDYRQICEQLYNAFEGIKKAVSKDDLEALEYLRHKASHPYIESYRLTFDKNHKPKIERRGENKQVLRSRIEDHINRCGGFRSFAFDLVGKLKDLVPGFLACIQIQCVRRGTPGGKVFISQMLKRQDSF